MIHIVGCNHGIQPRDEDWLAGDTPEAKDQKFHFTRLIEEIIKKHEIQFVGEEWGLPEMTNAHSIAGDDHWRNVNTCPNELKEMGIPPKYLQEEHSTEQKNQWNRQREQVMVRKIQENRNNAEKLLVVCGFDHLEPLADLLRAIDASITLIDYRKLDWYQPGVFPDDT